KFDKVDTIYPDVKADHWASGAIAYTTQMGIFEGRPDGTFGPQVNITRAEYATIVARYKGILSGTPRFSDVAGHWAENYIYACGDTGIVTGYTDGTFKPNNPIIRAEAVAMTNRMLHRKGDISFILTHLTPDMIFPDVDSSYWAFDHIYEASLTHEYIRNEDESETWIRILESGRTKR
ncbi:MAG: S-layer homology domain-containing protein, partial [Tissierellia bacterium]|nr:S-layer homology domain-containing protein [Tissierellia bacterium]